MSNEQAAPETKGVTVELLATVDLGPEIEGMAGRQLRMRTVTIEPGGVFGPIHDHKDRPGIVYILQGTITDHRNGVATDYGPGVGWPEDRNTTHWLENRGTIPAVEISVDIVKESAQAQRLGLHNPAGKSPARTAQAGSASAPSRRTDSTLRRPPKV
jgi:quercetin dioxygenase-like cupin family protein